MTTRSSGGVKENTWRFNSCMIAFVPPSACCVLIFYKSRAKNDTKSNSKRPITNSQYCAIVICITRKFYFVTVYIFLFSIVVFSFTYTHIQRRLCRSIGFFGRSVYYNAIYAKNVFNSFFIQQPEFLSQFLLTI